MTVETVGWPKHCFHDNLWFWYIDHSIQGHYEPLLHLFHYVSLLFHHKQELVHEFGVLGHIGCVRLYLGLQKYYQMKILLFNFKGNGNSSK